MEKGIWWLERLSKEGKQPHAATQCSVILTPPKKSRKSQGRRGEKMTKGATGTHIKNNDATINWTIEAPHLRRISTMTKGKKSSSS